MQAVVIYTGREKMVGLIEDEEVVMQAFSDNMPIQLTNVRVMIESLQANPSAGGEMQSINRSVILLPPDILSGPADEMEFRPVGIFFPKDKDLETLNDLIASAEKSETEMRAVKAGIHLPGRAKGFGRTQ